MVKFCTAFTNAFKNYSNFSGRIRRSEYWFFLLVVNTLTVLLTLFFILFATGTIGGHYYNSYYHHNYDYDYYHYRYYRTNEEATLALLIVLSIYIAFIMLPTLSATVRRLHDTGRRGEYIFIGLVPFFGQIALLALLCTDSNRDTNEYGPSPKYTNAVNNYLVVQPPIQNASAPAVSPLVTPLIQTNASPVPMNMANNNINNMTNNNINYMTNNNINNMTNNNINNNTNNNIIDSKIDVKINEYSNV